MVQNLLMFCGHDCLRNSTGYDFYDEWSEKEIRRSVSNVNYSHINRRVKPGTLLQGVTIYLDKLGIGLTIGDVRDEAR